MDELHRLQSFFQTLSDANRLKIIRFVGNESRSVSEMVEATGLSQPLVSHHLKVLRERKILCTRRAGPFIYYKLNDSRILDGLGLFSEVLYEACSEPENLERMFSCPKWFKRVFK